jgi:hypothetical protein
VKDCQGRIITDIDEALHYTVSLSSYINDQTNANSRDNDRIATPIEEYMERELPMRSLEATYNGKLLPGSLHSLSDSFAMFRRRTTSA